MKKKKTNKRIKYKKAELIIKEDADKQYIRTFI